MTISFTFVEWDAAELAKGRPATPTAASAKRASKKPNVETTSIASDEQPAQSRPIVKIKKDAQLKIKPVNPGELPVKMAYNKPNPTVISAPTPAPVVKQAVPVIEAKQDVKQLTLPVASEPTIERTAVPNVQHTEPVVDDDTLDLSAFYGKVSTDDYEYKTFSYAEHLGKKGAPVLIPAKRRPRYSRPI